jgi:hypothetical protein
LTKRSWDPVGWWPPKWKPQRSKTDVLSCNPFLNKEKKEKIQLKKLETDWTE